MKNKISSYLAVIIFERYNSDTTPSSHLEILERSISISLKFSILSRESCQNSNFNFSAVSIEVLTQRAISLVTLSQPIGIIFENFKLPSS
jgi:hypothetical protein